MAVLTQYNYIFAIGTIFAFLDAWNIGANDVANSWATSVASRSVTYIQAMFLGGIMEFAGAVGAGARVSDTIRTKIVSPSHFMDDPAVLMLGMLCAVLASAVFLTLATKAGFPISTTHSILGGVLGMGIAAVGASNVTWVARYDNGNMKIGGGVVSVFLAWIIAPCISGGFAAVIFLFTKFVVLRRNSVKFALFTIPFYFAVTAALLCMLIVTKGGRLKKNTLTGDESVGVVIGTGAGFAVLVTFFLVPWLYRKVVMDDWKIRWYHILMGPFVLTRGEVPPLSPGQSDHIRNFYAGHLTREELDAHRQQNDPETQSCDHGEHESKLATPPLPDQAGYKHKSIIGPKPEGRLFSFPVLYWYAKWLLLRGVDKDVIHSQKEEGILTGNLEETHASATHYDNKVEYIFAFLQVMTAATASFTHGANDVANAIGPYSAIYEIWQTGRVPPKKSTVPDWILAYGGGAIMIGLWTYGYRIMKNLGNRLILQSPSRGFCIELGTAVAIILATKLALPVSTTQCITGATIAVGLCNGTWRAINWRMVAWIYIGWVITVPVAGLFSGCLMAFVINAPRFS